MCRTGNLTNARDFGAILRVRKQRMVEINKAQPLTLRQRFIVAFYQDLCLLVD